MAGGALDDGAGVALKLLGRFVVIGAVRTVGPYGVGAAVAGFTGYIAMSLAEAKARIRIFRKALVERQKRDSRSYHPQFAEHQRSNATHRYSSYFLTFR